MICGHKHDMLCPSDGGVLWSTVFMWPSVRQTKSDDEHKLAKPTKYAEDEEILRVPIALAMVKLLQSLPKNTLQRNLPG